MLPGSHGIALPKNWPSLPKFFRLQKVSLFLAQLLQDLKERAEFFLPLNDPKFLSETRKTSAEAAGNSVNRVFSVLHPWAGCRGGAVVKVNSFSHQRLAVLCGVIAFI